MLQLVFTQRVKLSGMRWKKTGLQVMLTFRMLVVSDVWSATYAEMLKPCASKKMLLNTVA